MGMGLDLGLAVVNRLRGKPSQAPLLDPNVPPLTPMVTLTQREKDQEARNLRLLEPSTAAFAKGILIWARANGLRAILGETYRSAADQAALPATRTTIAPGKLGWHQVGRAFHLVIKTPSGQIDKMAYRTVGDEVERRGGVWLGRKPLKGQAGEILDLAHFEYHPGLSLGTYRGSPLASKEIAMAERRASRRA
jgi:hypothetical protein